MKKIAFLFSLAVILGLMPSCHHTHEDAHDHDHHAEQYTSYSDQYELYVEADPFVQGQSSHVTVRVTRLSDFKPVEAVPAKVSLIVSTKCLTHNLEHPVMQGVYECNFKPSVSGCGRLEVELSLKDSTVVLSIPHFHVEAAEECHDHDHAEGEEHEHSHGEDHEHSHEGHDHSHGHDHEHSHDHGSAAATNAITFSKEQSWKIDFATAVIEEKPFGSIIKASAQVLPSQGDEREVAASTSGVVVFDNASLVEGTPVKAGQHLFTIESNGMADNNMSVRFQEAAANYNAAKAEYERKQQLADDKIVSQSELQRAKAEYQTAKAAYDNLKANFSQKGAIVRAPINGYIQRINVSNGSFVEAGHSVVAVSQNRDLMLRAEVQPRYYSQLAHITNVNILVPGESQAYSLKDLGGSLMSYGKATDADCPMVPVTFRVKNTGNLLSGSFVTAYITTDATSTTLAIPNTGLVEEMGNFFVFVQINPVSFEKRLVTLGATDGVNTEILSGVKAGERVVTRGASMVRLAQNAGALDPHAGHVH